MAHTLRHIGDFAAITVAARDTSPLAEKVRVGLMSPDTEPGATGRAFVLSSYAHILDYDDIHDLGRVHPSSVVVAAALAAASLQPVPHARLLRAVSAGSELLCRLGLAWKPQGTGPGSDWFLTQLFGYFAAAATAGLVLDLAHDQLQSALGLAYMQAAGGKEAGFGTGGNARAIYPAFAAMGGVQSVLLARAGLVGPPSSLDGVAGFFPLYFGSMLSQEQRETLLDQDLEAWLDTQMKPWPSCRHSHPFVWAASTLRRRQPRVTNKVARVTVRANQSAYKLCAPIDQRRRPQTLQDAKYSVPFMVAFGLVHGEPNLRNLNEASMVDASVLEMAGRVDVEPTHDDAPGLPHACILLKDEAGAVHVFDEAYEAPDPEALVDRKIKECLSLAGFDDAEVAAAKALLSGTHDGDCAALLDLLQITPPQRRFPN
jgi:2-methylcitrate dehydratase PrpD